MTQPMRPRQMQEKKDVIEKMRLFKIKKKDEKSCIYFKNTQNKGGQSFFFFSFLKSLTKCLG